MKDSQEFPQTLIEAVRYFSDSQACVDLLAEMRWPDGVTCPHCGSQDVRYLRTRQRWECKAKHPKRQFSVMVGTIFERSHIGLDKWLAAIWMLANAKNGVSSYELARALGITQKSAWFVLHRIRVAMQTRTFAKLSGEVEIDETFIGGKARNMHKGKRKVKGRGAVGKAIVMGMLERHGNAMLHVVPNTDRQTLQRKIRQHVEAGSRVYTDALASYASLEGDYFHAVIDHAEAYAEGNVHTNCLENFWSLLKRSIHGTYVSVEPFHLFRYLDEQAFRFNNRENTDCERFLRVVNSVAGKRLECKNLVGWPS